jgi:hypothetical protein
MTSHEMPGTSHEMPGTSHEMPDGRFATTRPNAPSIHRETSMALPDHADRL